MLLYIHVPFCRGKCRYCAFYSEPLDTGFGDGPRRVRAYLDVIRLEMSQWADRLGRRRVESVFFGGGTPSLLPAKAVGSILDQARRCFDVAEGAEITLESNPDSLASPALARDYLRAGVNRISLGFQALDENLLALLGRPHSAQDAVRACYAAREAGCANLSLDLMWGLPGQKVAQWKAALREIVKLRPDHISAYGLSLELGTPLAEDCENGLLILPPEQDQAAMYLDGAALLEEAGLMQYEISNFARMGYQCRHNLGYWEGAEYLGLGPAATSTIMARRWTNPADLNLWGRMITAKRIPDEIEQLDARARLLELLMLRLRTVRGLRVKAYRDLTGRDFLKDHQRLVRALHRKGLVRIRNGYFSLTRGGMLVSDSILAAFFDAAKAMLGDATPKRDDCPAGEPQDPERASSLQDQPS